MHNPGFTYRLLFCVSKTGCTIFKTADHTPLLSSMITMEFPKSNVANASRNPSKSATKLNLTTNIIIVLMSSNSMIFPVLTYHINQITSFFCGTFRLKLADFLDKLRSASSFPCYSLDGNFRTTQNPSKLVAQQLNDARFVAYVHVSRLN